MSAQQRRLVIHIGTHKTGSSSLQHWLGSIRPQLAEKGLAYFRGAHEPDNHVELFAVPMRTEREAFARQKYGITGSAEEFVQLQAALRAFDLANAQRDLVFSCEGLSLLRHDDELERFKALVCHSEREPVIVLVLRDKSAFLASFRKQILKHHDRSLSDDPTSINYVEPDSWLADFDAIKAIWARHFGAEALQVVDYDAAMRACGDALPAVLEAIGIPEPFVPEPGSVRINQDSWKIKLRRALRKFGVAGK